MEISEYIKQINEQYATGNAREHSYRPMLQQLLQDMLTGFVVTNEPARINCGAPDYIISTKNGNLPVFFIEAKDVDDGDLDGRKEHKEQFNRYKESLDHIIFTDYLDFHLYENGEWVKNVRLAEFQGNKIKLIKSAVPEFEELIAHIRVTRPQPINSASKLAQQMAAKARMFAQTIKSIFDGEDDDMQNQQLQSQLNAFRNILIHDLSTDDFADLYAQTVAYGLFAARLHDDTPEDFSRIEAAMLIPKTNPFLRQIFQQIAGYDLDQRIAWIVDDLVSIFLATDLEKVMKSYSKNGLHNDPLIHFYEDFLTAYNPDERKRKGVWYTPQPVVQFIVRAVDEILQRDFNLPNGLADESMMERVFTNPNYLPGDKKIKPTITKKLHRVQILDPATGTGTFLAEVVNQIHDKFQGMQGMWQGYVEQHLIPRLHGFELLMASYAIAHIKLDMLLKKTGYDHNSDKRFKVYLTNSLEECKVDRTSLFSEWLSNEANEANRIKKDCPVMVMIGNPPYSISSSNKSKWITKLVDDYKQNLNERNIQPLSDDYIKFIRLAQDYVVRNGEGIMAYISNNSFIDGIIHREMRHQLLLAYDDIYIVNLHGNARKKETAPDGSKDENVFDIMQGVSVNIFVRKPGHKDSALGKVHYKDLFGIRDAKYDYLASSNLDNIDWKDVEYKEPEYFFVPKDYTNKSEYDEYVKIDELFLKNKNGVESGKDDYFVDFNYESLYSKINNSFSNKQGAIDCYNFKNTDSFRIVDSFMHAELNGNYIKAINYRPFDARFIYYEKTMIRRSSPEIMQHMVNNIGVVVCKQQSTFDFQHILVTDKITERCFVSSQTKETGYIFPLYLYKEEFGEEKKIPNLNADEWKKFNDAVGRDTTPEELLAYIYAILHSPSYRERYKEFLKVDFPRIPLPQSVEEFERFANIGQQLMELHLLKNASAWKTATQFPEAGSMQVDKPVYKDGNVWINDTQYFGNVPDIAWNAYIGGYQPAQKWLKDRKGRTLTFDDVKHYFHIIHALTETVRLMNEIG